MQYFPGTDNFLYAGDFFINTGYDDPGGVGDNLAVARENYAAQVFAHSADMVPNNSANPCDFRITAIPTFGAMITPGAAGSSATQVARVWLKCSVWASPTSRVENSRATLTSVSWALYKV